jgi:hypothetical protein
VVRNTRQRLNISKIIEIINERFGLHLTEADQSLFDQSRGRG